jgi:hypothetical protein
MQPCGLRLRALLPEWLPAYEADHRRLDADLRHNLLSACGRTSIDCSGRCTRCADIPGDKLKTPLR